METLIYEKALDYDARWALTEGSRHFEGESAVFGALHNVAARLAALDIPYAVVGGMALFQHGLRRFTEDVDILVTKENLRIIHERLEGLGYRPPFERSKHLRDTKFGVKIEFLTTGDYPGDRKEKPVRFPDPETVNFVADGISYVNLKTLIKLKLASGMTNAGRLKDLADVLELIKILNLPEDFRDRLNPYVQTKFEELWAQSQTRYVLFWRLDDASTSGRTTEETAALHRAAREKLARMRDEGALVDEGSETDDSYARLTTTDPALAKRYGFVEESDYWDEDAGGTT